MNNKKYLLEPILNSELILFNNSKLLKKNENLYNDKFLSKIEALRVEYEQIYYETGYQHEKRDIRNELRDLSVDTFVYRDANIFGNMIIQIIDGIASRPNFSNYSYLNEMKSLAVEHILKYTWKFDPYKKSKITGQYISAFTYLSTITFNAFVATINKRNKELQNQRENFYDINDNLDSNQLTHITHIQKMMNSRGSSDNEITHSEIIKTISLPNLKDNTLFETLFVHDKSNESGDKSVVCVNSADSDVLVQIPENYFITPDELKKIYDYTDKIGICLSIKRLPLSYK